MHCPRDGKPIQIVVKYDHMTFLNTILHTLLITFHLTSFANSKNVLEFSNQMKDLIERAEKNSSEAKNATHELFIAEFELKNARNLTLPSLDFSTRLGLKDQSPRTTGPYGSELSLTLTEVFYNNGMNALGESAAESKVQTAKHRLVYAQNKVAFEVLSTYLNYSYAVKSEAILKKQNKILREQTDLISKGYYKGEKTKRDFLRFKSQLTKNEMNLRTITTNVEKQYLEFCKVVGISNSVQQNEPSSDRNCNSLFSILIPFNFEKINTQTQFNNDNFDHFPILKILSSQRKTNELLFEISKKKNSLEVTLSSVIDYSNSQFVGTGQRFSENGITSWNALLGVKYNFWDWGTRNNLIRIAAENKSIEENKTKTEELSLRTNYEIQKKNLVLYQKNLEQASTLMTLEKENFQTIDRDYRNGKSQYLDLVSGLNDLSDAESRYFSAANEFLISKINLMHLEGNLYEFVKK